MGQGEGQGTAVLVLAIGCLLAVEQALCPPLAVCREEQRVSDFALPPGREDLFFCRCLVLALAPVEGRSQADGSSCPAGFK